MWVYYFVFLGGADGFFLGRVMMMRKLYWLMLYNMSGKVLKYGWQQPIWRPTSKPRNESYEKVCFSIFLPSPEPNIRPLI